MKMVFAIVNKDDSGVVSEALTQEIEAAYERWEFLTQKAQSCAKN